MLSIKTAIKFFIDSDDGGEPKIYIGAQRNPKKPKKIKKKNEKTELKTSQYVISKHTAETYNQNSKVLGAEYYSDHWKQHRDPRNKPTHP